MPSRNASLVNSQATLSVTIGIGAVTIDDVVAVARHDATVIIDSSAREAISASRAIIDALSTDTQPHYGISTGFGALASEGRCVTCIGRADAANVVHRQRLRDARHAAGSRAAHIQIR